MSPEDTKPMGGKPTKYPGREETVWLVKTDWPLPGTVGRLVIRVHTTPWIDHHGEVHNDAITLERGRVWNQAQADGDDGA
jgi:hypothetical protein